MKEINSILGGLLVLFCSIVMATAQTKSKTATNAAPVRPVAVHEELNPGDKLLFVIAEDPLAGAAPDEIMVNARFDLHFPVSRGFGTVVTINAKGKTLSQVQQELKTKLDEAYYQSATVHLKLKEQTARAGQILVFGAVRNSFVTLMPGEQKKALETILQAGPSEFANLKKVKISRIDPTTGKLEVISANIENIKKDPTKDFFVRDGDRIEVPEKSIVF